MQGFLIRLREINADQAYQLYLYARTRCSDYNMIPEQTNKSITLCMGVLHEPVCWKKFMKNMRSNLASWGIEHVTNKLWIEELTTIDEYIRISGGFSDLRSKAVSDAIVRDLANKEVAAVMKVKCLQLGERQVMKNDRFITRSIFNAFVANVNHKRQRLSHPCSHCSQVLNGKTV
jgi:hypothetical protein